MHARADSMRVGSLVAGMLPCSGSVDSSSAHHTSRAVDTGDTRPMRKAVPHRPVPRSKCAQQFGLRLA